MNYKLLTATMLLVSSSQAATVIYDWSTFPSAPAGGTTGITPNQRPAFFGTPSTFANAKTYSGSFGSGGYDFVTLISPDLDNAGGSAIGLQVNYGVTGTSYIGLVFYANSFDPNNLGVNYLADSGSLFGNGGQGLIQFMLPGNTQAVAVLFPQLNQTNGKPNAIASLQAIPEPATWSLAGLALLAGMVWRRKKSVVGVS